MDDLAIHLRGPDNERSLCGAEVISAHTPVACVSDWAQTTCQDCLKLAPSRPVIVEKMHRTAILMVRLSADERIVIAKAAGRAGLPVGTWLRSIALRAARREMP